MQKEVIIIKNTGLMFINAAILIDMISEECIKKNNKFSLVLSAGNTPVPLYNILSKPPFLYKIKWQNIHVFQADERCVPIDHADRNYKTLSDNLINPLKLAKENIHALEENLESPEKAGLNYENEIKSFFSNEKFPVFDLIILGIGKDGHTASLFPEDKHSLKIKNRLVINTCSKIMKPKGDRITLTLNAINKAKNVIFLISGENKKKIADEVINKKNRAYPASMVKPEEKLFIFYDHEI